MTRRAVFYLRLSSSDEASTSIARQEVDLRALAEREGWEVVRVLTDDGISGRKARANATEALRLLRAAEADVIAVWKLDRWSRQGLGAIGDLVETLDATPGALFVALQDGLRSDQAAWRLIAAVLSEVARTEADNTAMRVKSSVKALRHSGRWPGGIVPFAYWPADAPDGPGRILKPHPPEAAVVREFADRTIAGESLTRLVRDLHDREVPTPRSAYRRAQIAGKDPEGLDRGTWRLSSFRQVWSANYLLGRATESGQLIRDEDGLPLTVFEPVLDLATLTQLRARLGDPRQKGVSTATIPKKPRVARLLSGIAYCAECDGRLYVGSSNGFTTYRCPMAGSPGKCPGVRVMADALEEYVERRFVATYGDAPEYHETETAVAMADESALAEVEAAIRETLAALGDDEADAAALLRRLEALKGRRTELREAPVSVEYAATPTGRTLAEAWLAEDDVEKRRKVLLAAVDHVAVKRASVRGSHFSPSRVDIRWNS